LNFLDRFKKSTQISNFKKKNLPVAAQLLHADGQTNRHEEANSDFSQYCEVA